MRGLRLALIMSVLIVLGTGIDATVSALTSAIVPPEVRIEKFEKQLGPFEIEGRFYSVVLKMQRIATGTADTEETVESVSILDKEGREHFRRSFPVTIRGNAFEETAGVSAFSLESGGKSLFKVEGETTIKTAVDEGKTIGLILNYGFLPTAPLSGVSCQVFLSSGDRLSPVSKPLTVYGKLYDLNPGRRPDSRRLLPGDIMMFGVWTGWFEVVAPVRIGEEIRIVPNERNLTYGLDSFAVKAERVTVEGETFVRLFRFPGDRTPDHVIIRPDSSVEFLSAYASVKLETVGEGIVIGVRESPWLKVRIDGKEGYVRDGEDLRALGLREAG